MPKMRSHSPPASSTGPPNDPPPSNPHSRHGGCCDRVVRVAGCANGAGKPAQTLNTKLPTYFNYQTYESHPMKGAEDWQGVATLDDGGGYDWTTLNVYYSPAARRYFWHGDSGCSCNAWGDDVSTADDFENGSRADAIAAVKRFADERSYSFHGNDSLNTVTEIQAFKEATK